jgi:hypothetical protein
MYLQGLHLLMPDYYPENDVVDESVLFKEEIAH